MVRVVFISHTTCFISHTTVRLHCKRSVAYEVCKTFTSVDGDQTKMRRLVQGRMNRAIHIFSADALYHRACHARFKHKLPHTPHTVKHGRP